MEIINLIDALEDIIEGANQFPLTGKAMVDKNEVLDLIQDLRLNLPDDLKEAKWISEEKQKILEDAQKESQNIIKNAKSKIPELVGEHEIVRKAQIEANEIIKNANETAESIKSGARKYSDDMLKDLSFALKEALDVVNNNIEKLNEE